MKYIVALAVSALVAAPAFAGSTAKPVAEPVVVPIAVAPMKADWTGGYAGGQLGYGNFTTKNSALKGNGAVGGVFGGYRYDWGDFVGGIELGFDTSNIKSSDKTAKLKGMTRLGLQAGYDMGQTLVYGTVGMAHARASVAGVNYSDNGWFAGVGVDYQLKDRWVLGGQIVYNKFKNFNKTGVDLKGTTAQVRVSYRF